MIIPLGNLYYALFIQELSCLLVTYHLNDFYAVKFNNLKVQYTYSVHKV